MTLDSDNARLLGDFARKLRSQKYREIHIYYSPIDYYIIKPQNVINVEVREYGQGSQQVLHIENKNWDLDLPTQLIGTVVWHKKSEKPDQHPLTKALNNINYQKITVTLTNQHDVEIPADKISNVEEQGRNVNIFLQNGNMIDIDLRYVVSVNCEQRLGENSRNFDKAVDFLEDQKWNKGIELLEKLVQDDPSDYDALHRLGYAHFRNKQPHKALEYIERSIAINPYRSLTWLLKSKALQEIDRYEDAETCLIEAIEKFPNDIHLKMELSSVYTREEKYEDAIQTQNLVLEEQPENFEEWEYLGYIADQKGDLPLAITAFKKVLEFAPEKSDIYRKSMQNLGCRLCHQGEVEAAIQNFKSLTEKFPDQSGNWDLLACIYRRTNKFDLAETAIRKAIEIEPEDSQNWASLGYTIWEKDLKKAEEACRKAVKMDSENEYNWTALAKILFAKNETKEAIKACNKAEELGSESGTNFYNIADGYATIKDAKKVMHYLRKALEIDKTQIRLLEDDKSFEFLRENEEFINLQKEFSN